MRRPLLILLAAVAACVDGPFERTNPADLEVGMAMSIVGGVDTATVVGQTILYRLVTTPVVEGHVPTWESGTPSLVITLGFGRFRVVALPSSTPVPVTIRARFGSRVVERALLLMPAVP